MFLNLTRMISLFIYTQKRTGEDTASCLTPFETLKLSECSFPQRTSHFCLAYIYIKHLMTRGNFTIQQFMKKFAPSYEIKRFAQIHCASKNRPACSIILIYNGRNSPCAHCST